MAGSQHNCQNGGHVSEAAGHERAHAPRNLELLRRVRLAVVTRYPCVCRMDCTWVPLTEHKNRAGSS